MRKYLKPDLIIPAIFFLFSSVFFVMTFDYSAIASRFPRAISFLVMALTLWYIAAALLRTRKEIKAGTFVEPEKKAAFSFKEKQWFYYFFAMIGYVILINFVGFVGATFIFTFGIAYIIGYKRLLNNFLFAAILTAIVYGLARWVMIPLPKGILLQLIAR